MFFRVARFVGQPALDGQHKGTSTSGTLGDAAHCRLRISLEIYGPDSVNIGGRDQQTGCLALEGVDLFNLLCLPGSIDPATLMDAASYCKERGAHQMASGYKYVPVRRRALYLEKSLYHVTQWVVLEPNDEPPWAQICWNIGAVMTTLLHQVGIHGSAPRDACLVKCDRETTTADDINRGTVNILVGFALMKPAEFLIIQIQQLAGLAHV